MLLHYFAKLKTQKMYVISILLMEASSCGRLSCLLLVLGYVTYAIELASCLSNAQPLPAHRPAADDNSLIGCTGHGHNHIGPLVPKLVTLNEF